MYPERCLPHPVVVQAGSMLLRSAQRDISAIQPHVFQGSNLSCLSIDYFIWE